MTAADWVAAYCAAGTLAIIFLIWAVAHVAHQDGYEAGRLDERELSRQRSRAVAHRPPTRLVTAPYVPGRHAPWQPRLTVTRAATVALEAAGPSSLTVPLSMRATDSGELRGLVAGTDAYIDHLKRSEAAYRQQLVTR